MQEQRVDVLPQRRVLAVDHLQNLLQWLEYLSIIKLLESLGFRGVAEGMVESQENGVLVH